MAGCPPSEHLGGAEDLYSDFLLSRVILDRLGSLENKASLVKGGNQAWKVTVARLDQMDLRETKVNQDQKGKTERRVKKA
ncbi:UNVERIFIED_CONTAM: hypothetical protein K2H54_046925 [Gekko kuhli]